MNLPIVDKVLVMFLLVLCFLVADTRGRADPVPVECDNFCRERRFTKLRPKEGLPLCLMTKYRDCDFCVTGLCNRNMIEDQLTTGKCELMTTMQKRVFVDDCQAMCPFPVEAGAAVREAAEGPNTYVGNAAWMETGAGVRKCYVPNVPFKEWEDEKQWREETKWKQKKID